MAAREKLTPPLKWHGGKSYLAKRIVGLMPPHLHYVEPYAGGLSVLLAKDPEGVSEVVNDIDGCLTNFWRVLQGDESYTRFRRLVQATPFSQVQWEDADPVLPPSGGEVGDAFRFFVRCRQSLAGRGDSFAPLSRTRTRRGMNEQASAWLTAVEGLPQVHSRLKRVAILNRDALDVIRQQDGPKTLFYLDPPYLHGTRTTTGEYDHEMTEGQHQALLDVLGGIKGKFLLSGYWSQMYTDAMEEYGWQVTTFDLPNNSAGGTVKRRMTECVWTNFDLGDR